MRRFLNYSHGLCCMTAQRIGNIGTLLYRIIIKLKIFLLHTFLMAHSSIHAFIFSTQCMRLNLKVSYSIHIKLFKLKANKRIIKK